MEGRVTSIVAVAGANGDSVNAGRARGQRASDFAGRGVDAQARRQVDGGEGERVAVAAGSRDSHATDGVAFVVGLIGRRRDHRRIRVGHGPGKRGGAGVEPVRGADGNGVSACRLGGQRAGDDAGRGVDGQARGQVSGGVGERVGVGVGRGHGHAGNRVSRVVGLMGRRRHGRGGDVLDVPGKAGGAGVGAVGGLNVDGVGAGRLPGQRARDRAGGGVDDQSRRQVGRGERQRAAVAAGGRDGHAGDDVALIVVLSGRRGDGRGVRVVHRPGELGGAGARTVAGRNGDREDTSGRGA